MKPYSDYPARRARQILVDVLALATIGAWIWLGVALYGLVLNLQSFGVQMSDAGAGFRQTMLEVEQNLSRVPLVGDGISAPFTDASEAGAALEQAGETQQVVVQQLATGLGVGLAVVPALMILIAWLIPRLRFARRAGVAARISRRPASTELLALRAIARQPLSALAQLHPDVAHAWRTGDSQVITALAALELKSSGVRQR
jgi:hypothetical protein